MYVHVHEHTSQSIHTRGSFDGSVAMSMFMYICMYMQD